MYAVINMMAVFLGHQRKEIGKLLLDWGLQLADEMQALVSHTHASLGLVKILIWGYSALWKEH
jgi:hypothetical protein